MFFQTFLTVPRDFSRNEKKNIFKKKYSDQQNFKKTTINALSVKPKTYYFDGHVSNL